MMQIVIEIDENLYTRLFDNGIDIALEDRQDIEESIRNGIPLPKGHGRLIDGDALEKYVIEKYSDGEQLAIDISEAPTIIEADEENKNDL